jgi:hypothetical protein
MIPGSTNSELSLCLGFDFGDQATFDGRSYDDELWLSVNSVDTSNLHTEFDDVSSVGSEGDIDKLLLDQPTPLSQAKEIAIVLCQLPTLTMHVSQV